MAGLLESIVVPRAFAAPPAASFSVSALSGRLTSLNFPAFGGLKVQSSRSSSPVNSSSRIYRRRLGGIACEAQETAVQSAAVPSVTENTWQSLVTESVSPVLVEFWAPWCGPCKMIRPVIDELAKLYTGKIKCYNLNTDENPNIATRFGIRSIPTVIIFIAGEKKDAIIGAVPRSTLIASIEKFF